MKMKKVTSSLALRIIGGIVCLLLAYNLIVQTIGYIQFTESLTREYNDSAFRTAETAVTLVDGDKIDEYLRTGGDSDEYRDRLRRMDILCQMQNVTLIYAIKVDTSDYGRFVNIYNSVNQNSTYSRWEIGYQRDTTNEEYAKIYRDIYENGLERGTVLRTTDLRGKEPHITSLVPVKDSNGDVRAILCVQRPMEELSVGRQKYLKSVGITAMVLTVVACITTALFLRFQFVKPVKRIIREAERFASENTAPEHTSLENISTIAEIQALGSSVAKMEMDTLQYMNNLMHVTAERERIDTELSLATRIQANMLPNIFPAFPDRTEFDIHASMTPAKEVGGDFYDFFLIDEDHLGLVMADVSGKGVPAALFMMMAKILLYNYAMLGGTPHEVLERLNATICKNNDDSMFVTVWFGIYTISTGNITAANAGHEYPIVKRGEKGFEVFKDRHGFVIGGMDGLKYRDYSFDLAPGEMLFLYTDGVPEATDENNNMFGTERLLEVLNAAGDVCTKDLLEAVRTGVEGFVGKAPQFDDLTMMAIKRT
ncbi:MAG: PP2C family protein-serine/threonine phosphatase [Oscillospiraceae bacterium]|nr:PP2C family protein-serine/threonine phosphatase [Oscillospiraceae bacterium]